MAYTTMDVVRPWCIGRLKSFCNLGMIFVIEVTALQTTVLVEHSWILDVQVVAHGTRLS